MHEQRKLEHLRISLEKEIECEGVSTGFERYRLVHEALPDLDLETVDTTTAFLDCELDGPLIISAMTGGTSAAGVINRRLAEAAEEAGVALALGSQRAAIEDPGLAHTYQVRHLAPSVPLLANLGAVQLNHGYGLDECRRAVEMVEANMLVLHLNPLQEALQVEGTTCFAGLLGRIESVCSRLEVPVIVKEVGWGLSEHAARQLAEAGVAAIDVAGAGGSSWSRVEMYRATSEPQRRLAEAFATWGIPTAESLLLAQQGAPGIPVVASGGIREGTEMAKAMAMGAALCGVARPFLQVANDSTGAVLALISVLLEQLRTTMFVIGARDIPSLRQMEVVEPTWRGGPPAGERSRGFRGVGSRSLDDDA